MDEYEILDKIGDGAFGKVYLARKRNNKNTSINNICDKDIDTQQSNDIRDVKITDNKLNNWQHLLLDTSAIDTKSNNSKPPQKINPDLQAQTSFINLVKTAKLNKKNTYNDEKYNKSNNSKQSNCKTQRHKELETYFAIKKLDKKYKSWAECKNLREIVALKQLKHVNLIKLLEIIRENDYLFLVFEHMQQNLSQLIQKQSSFLSEKIICSVGKQILLGLHYIHSKGFFHRDIKPENLLCNGFECIKIADFGLTRLVTTNNKALTDYVSTRWYRAPELLLRAQIYTPAIDIWAFGCVLGELCNLQPLFAGRSELDQLMKICIALGSPDCEHWPESKQLLTKINFKYPQIETKSLNELLPRNSPTLQAIIADILTWTPSERPIASALLAHSFFLTK